jgi:hypothetical protein
VALFKFCNYAFEDSLPFDEQLPVKALKLVLGTVSAPASTLHGSNSCNRHSLRLCSAGRGGDDRVVQQGARVVRSLHVGL